MLCVLCDCLCVMFVVYVMDLLYRFVNEVRCEMKLGVMKCVMEDVLG